MAELVDAAGHNPCAAGSNPAESFFILLIPERKLRAVIIPDFETRSRVDLRKCGSSVYARHESTEVLCLAWTVNGGDVQLWVPGDPDPVALFNEIEKGTLVCPHNAMFERQIWRHICHERFGWPDVQFKQWRCSAAACSRLTLPRSLEGAGAALGLAVQKDDAGHRLMLKMCKPRRETKNNKAEWHETPEDLQKLYRYCERDVETQALLSETAGQLTASELKVWQLDQRINLRGIPVDRKGIRNALAIVEAVHTNCCEQIEKLTDGTVKTPKQVAAIRSWLLEKQGLVLPNLAAETVKNALASELPPAARELLELRQMAGKASTAKLQAFLSRCDEDGRVRNNLMYHGAATGRWSGYGVQIQNFPRGILNRFEIGLIHELLPDRNPRVLDMLLASPMDCISSSLRSFIQAEPDKRLMVCDFASIEARVLAWIAGQHDLVQVFREGGDVYKVLAGDIYGITPDEVTKTQRQVGKIGALALQYGMGPKKFVLACKVMGGVKITRKFAKQVVETYRKSNDRIKSFWGELNTAAIRAIQLNQPHRVGRLEIDSDGEWLTIQLPSGRKLHYREPELVEVRAPWSEGFEGAIQFDEKQTEDRIDKILNALEELDVDVSDVGRDRIEVKRIPKESTPGVRRLRLPWEDLHELEPKYIEQIQYKSVNSVTRKWGHNRTYGGKICENATQAIARDFLVEAMLRVEHAGYEIIGTVHDEIIAEIPYGFGSQAEFDRIMCQVPMWGAGCPINVDGYEAERYRK